MTVVAGVSQRPSPFGPTSSTKRREGRGPTRQGQGRRRRSRSHRRRRRGPRDPRPARLATCSRAARELDEAALGKAGELSARARRSGPRPHRALAMALARGPPATPSPSRAKGGGAEGSADSLAALAQARLGDPTGMRSERGDEGRALVAGCYVARGDALLAGRLGKDAEAAYRRRRDRPAHRRFHGLASPPAQGRGGPARAARKAISPTHTSAKLTPLASPTSPRILGQGERGRGRGPQGVFLGAQEPAGPAHRGAVFESRGRLAGGGGRYAEVGGLDRPGRRRP